MSRGEIVAVEGVCCAGKTTLIGSLSRNFKTTVVPELPAFGRNLFRPFDGKESILHNGYTSIGLEKVRMVGALGLSGLSDQVLMDRSIISTLAINYGAIDIIGAPAFSELAHAVLSEIENGKLATPDKMLYIGVNGQVIEERNESRTPRLEPYWTNSKRVDRQNDFYQHLVGLDGIAYIDGARPHTEVLSDCSAYIVHDDVMCTEALTAQIENFVKLV